jgi:hypothetical protein
MIYLESQDQSGSEHFARWVAACVVEPLPQKDSSLTTILLLCAVAGVAVIVFVIAVVIIKRRKARKGGGDGLGGLDQPILDSEIDGGDISEAKTSW